MSKSFVKSIGNAKSIVINNGKSKMSGIKWNADYNGNVANIDLKLNNNGVQKQYKLAMDNNDLQNIFVPGVDKPLHNRIIEDNNNFNNLNNLNNNNNNNNNTYPYLIEFDNDSNSILNDDNYETTTKTNDFLTHISSPNSFEDLIIPFTEMTSYRRPNRYNIKTKKNIKKHKKYKNHKKNKHLKSYRVIKVKKNKGTSRRI